MRRLILTSLLAGAALAVAIAPIRAQTQPAPAQRAPAPARPVAPAAPALPAQKPYKTVAVTVPNIPRDPSFDTFRKELGDIAKRKDRAALGQRIVARDFFWERDFSGGFEPTRSSLDNLSTALMLDADDGSGWEVLAGFAGETGAGPLPGRSPIICAPTIPQFNEEARGELIDSTQ